MRKTNFLSLTLGLAVSVSQFGSALGAEFTLDESASGSWGDSLLWIGGVVPDSDQFTDIILQSSAGNPAISSDDGADPLDVVFRNLTYSSATASTALVSTLGGSFTLYGAIANPGGAGQTISAPLKLSPGSHLITSYASETLNFAGVVSNLSTAGGLEKAGTGRLILGTANTFSGSTLVTDGVLQVNNRNSLQNSTVNTGISGTQRIDIKSVNSGSLFTKFGALEGADNILVTSGAIDGASGARTLEVGRNNASTTYSGVISGEGAIVKAGTGRWNLTGTNLYSGTTTVSGGNLAVNGSTAGGAVSVLTGAKLSGNGTVGGLTTVQSGGTHAVGNSAGLQTFGTGITYNTGSIFEWELGSKVSTQSGGLLPGEGQPVTAGTAVRGTDFDAVDVTGSTTIQSGAIFKIVLGEAFDRVGSAFWDTRQVWSVFNTTGTKTGTFDTFQIWENGGANQLTANSVKPGFFSFDWGTDSLGANSGNLIWTPIPEPGNALVGLILGAGLLKRRRKLVTA